MVYEHKPGANNVRYFANGYVKVVDNRIFTMDKDGYVWDFYRDEEHLVTPDNEVTEEEALKKYVEIHGNENGFYTFTM